jgi:probable phosphoglycerate mutase
VGGWAGLTTAEIEARFPEDVTRWRSGDTSQAFDGGETYADMGARVIGGLREIAARHPGKQVLVVLHGGPIRALLAHAAGITYEEQRRRREHLDNCGFIRVIARGGGFAATD